MSESARRSPFAGTWYPADARELRELVEGQLEAAGAGPGAGLAGSPGLGRPVGVLAPHAGLVYSGPVAAHTYRLVVGGPYETVILLGPSHQVYFDALAVYPSGAFRTPLGEVAIDAELAESLLAESPHIRAMPEVHGREHCLEMQLPFLQVVLPGARIVPVMMGNQSRENIRIAAAAIESAVRRLSRSVLVVASSDLSHYETRERARALDERVLDCLRAFSPESLEGLLEREPRHACGGGPIVSVMEASRALGADRGYLLDYADSGDTTGDTSAVVGYAAAAFCHEGS